MANTQHFRQAIGNLNTPAQVKVWGDLVDDLEALAAQVVVGGGGAVVLKTKK